jgi:hypothetical protein
MGWKFISGEQPREKTEITEQRKGRSKERKLVRFIVGPRTQDDEIAYKKFTPIVGAVTFFLKKQTEGLSKQELASLEARLHAAISKLFRSRV